ncbi:p34 [Pseudomonas phage PaP2]|uniref:hypothetical protein n=1 Tax=Pseudomonas phage PaP2 TaxID=270673 RepID=UPI00003593D5|nr:hypothetical protein PaP2_gp33 [Pseudomonas phage PaP2]AAS89620.1 p34 [Pseudomonas phage PaP2]
MMETSPHKKTGLRGGLLRDGYNIGYAVISVFFIITLIGSTSDVHAAFQTGALSCQQHFFIGHVIDFFLSCAIGSQNSLDTRLKIRLALLSKGEILAEQTARLNRKIAFCDFYRVQSIGHNEDRPLKRTALFLSFSLLISILDFAYISLNLQKFEVIDTSFRVAEFGSCFYAAHGFFEEVIQIHDGAHSLISLY